MTIIVTIAEKETHCVSIVIVIVIKRYVYRACAPRGRDEANLRFRVCGLVT
jgi:hypothetical protein